MAQVCLERVSKAFGHQAVVRDVTVTVADREFVVLVGPSGCGKTTTLRLVAGLEEVSSGEIRIAGRLVNHVAPRDRDIAMVFQNYALYPHMNVEENMAFGLKLRRVPAAEIRRRVRETAALLGLGELLHRLPRQLSGGQRQRVALGRAMVREPAVFLMDEPLSNLDAKLRLQTRAELARLHRRLQATVVYVTHDQVEAMTLGDRIVVMHEGAVQQVGAPLAVYNRPANLFVAGFIGAPAMNLLRARLLGDPPALAPEGAAAMPLPSSLRSFGVRPGPVVLGVRPEHLHLHGDGPWRAAVEVVERLGPATLVHLSLGGQPLVVQAGPAHPAQPGETAPLLVDWERVHLFDPGDGCSLRPEVQEAP